MLSTSLLDDLQSALRAYLQKPFVMGKTYGFTMTLTVGQPVTKVYFSRKFGPSEGLPPGTIFFAPHRRVKTLIFVNEGPADIIYQVNGEPNEEYLTSVLRFQEERQVDSEKDGIFSLFCRAVPGSGPNPAIAPWGTLTMNNAYLRVETIG